MFQSAGILLYFEELKREPNAEIGPKDIFDMVSFYFRVPSGSYSYQPLPVLRPR